METHLLIFCSDLGQVFKVSPSAFRMAGDERHAFINDENRCELLRGFDEFLGKLSAPLWETDMTFGFVDQLSASSSAAHHRVPALALFTASLCVAASGFTR